MDKDTQYALRQFAIGIKAATRLKTDEYSVAAVKFADSILSMPELADEAAPPVPAECPKCKEAEALIADLRAMLHDWFIWNFPIPDIISGSRTMRARADQFLRSE